MTRITDRDIKKLTRDVDTTVPAKYHSSEVKVMARDFTRMVSETTEDDDDFLANMGDFFLSMEPLLGDDTPDDAVSTAMRAAKERRARNS